MQDTSHMDTLTSEASWKSRQMTLPGIDSATSSPASVDGPTLCVWPDGLTTAPSGQDHAHASHSASPESARGMATSAISGLNSCASSRSASLQASLESRLRARLEGRGSPLYALTWKRWDMPSGGGDLCAAGIGAPQIRQRLFWVADADYTGREGTERQGEPDQARPEWATACGEPVRSDRGPWPPGPGEVHAIPVLANGLPGVVGGCKGYGNAIVPQVAAEVISAYMATVDV